MYKKEDLVGKQFNDWTILDILPDRRLKCRCSCGKIKDVSKHSVLAGLSTNCGHARYQDIKGKVFGRLTVLEKTNKSCQWLCLCQCGRMIETTKYALEHGKNKCNSRCTGEGIIGKRFNKLTITGFNTDTKLWICKCDCGEERETDLRSLNSGSIKSCKKCANPIKIHEESKPKEKVARTELIGQTFNELTVIGFNIDTRLWICKCSCGNIKEVKGYDLLNNKMQTCGHNKNKPRTDLTGKQFSCLTVNKYIGNGSWECLCSCGNKTKATTTELIRGYKKSCGHLKIVDYTGRHVGELTILGRDPNNSDKWLCQCSCGNQISLAAGSLGHKGYKSCGHIKKNKFVNLLGQQFGELTVEEYLGHQKWLCSCSCGNKVEVLGHNLRRNVRSCGCKTVDFYNETMLDRYGDTSSARIDNPREDWQQEILADENLFKEFIDKIEVQLQHRPSAYEISTKLNVTPATIHNYAIKYSVLLRNAVSKFEDEILLLFPNLIQHNRELINGLELDFYDEEHKVAIEFNGDYWHSSIFKDSKYHQDKTIACAKQGIRLIHVFEYEWLNSDTRNKILNIIENALGSSEPIVLYGRDTQIKEISKEESDTFLLNYHLNGTANSSIRFGCFINDELIGVMTFGKPRFSRDFDYEIIRLAWKNDYRVIGGAKKLFTHFIRKYNPNTVLTYCDISKFKGNVYSSLGFISEEITKPNYVWVHKYKQSIKQRYETQKHILVKNYPDLADMTEDEIMTKLGYVKIYNSGNLRLGWYK